MCSKASRRHSMMSRGNREGVASFRRGSTRARKEEACRDGIQFSFIFISNISYTNMELTYPPHQAKLSFKVYGVYRLPDQWRTTDDANPALFTYSAKTFKFQFEKGKIYPKELSAKEQREAEEKNKKGGKKQGKKEEPNAEEERVRKAEQQEDRRKKEEYNKLSQQQKHYYSCEDPMESAQLRFEVGAKDVVISGKDLVIWEQRVNCDSGQWIYFYKYPAVGEEELAKLRKAKPKTLGNINDLNPIVMRAWIDLSVFHSKQTVVTVRPKLQQIERTADVPEPNLEKTYIKITISIGEPVSRDGDNVVAASLIAEPPAEVEVPSKVRVVDELKGEIRLALESLAMEYSGMFWKELNLLEELKSSQVFVNKKSEVTKRKEQFLYEFNLSGKYKVLKDRLKKKIVHLCEHKYADVMAGAKSFTGVSCTLKDQFYSEIYNFLVTSYKETLASLLVEKRETLNEVYVLSNSAQQAKIEQYLQKYRSETTSQRLSRIVKEYELLFNFEYCQEVYARYILQHPEDSSAKYAFATYSLKNQLKTPREVLAGGVIEELLARNKEDEQLAMQYLLLLIASENQGYWSKAWVFLREALLRTPNDHRLVMLAAFAFEQLGKDQSTAQKYFSFAEREQLRIAKTVTQKGSHQQAPLPNQVPNLKSLPTYAEALSETEKDSLWLSLIQLFEEYNITSMATKIQPKIKSKGNPRLKKIALTALLKSGKHEQFLTEAKALFEESKSPSILELLIQHLAQQNSPEVEKYLKVGLQFEDKQASLLRLADYYFKNKRYGNAKACLVKYLQKSEANSGLSLRMLGVCELEIGDYDAAEQCLRHSNLCDPGNELTWLWLSLLYSRQQQLTKCNQTLNQYQVLVAQKGRAQDRQVYQEIEQCIRKSPRQDIYDERVSSKLLARLRK